MMSVFVDSEFIARQQIIHRPPNCCRITAQSINHLEQETPV